MSAPVAVFLEIGTKRVFACALDWPGWCRSGRGEDAALEALRAYVPRFAPVATRAGLAPPAAGVELEVVERAPGTRGLTDFGAPGEVASADARPISAEEGAAIAALVESSWVELDRIAASAPEDLRKGPRGGGRDRTKIVDHVLGAEAAYARKIGVRHRRPANGDAEAIAALRADILAVLRTPSDGAAPAPRGWPLRYAARRIAWHALDHAWEIEDRTP